jgi:hypothetical protein
MEKLALMTDLFFKELNVVLKDYEEENRNFRVRSGRL